MNPDEAAQVDELVEQQDAVERPAENPVEPDEVPQPAGDDHLNEYFRQRAENGTIGR